MAVHPGLIGGRVEDDVADGVGHLYATQWQIAAGDAFGELHNIRIDAKVVAAEPFSSAPKTTNDLIHNQQNVVLFADGLHLFKIALVWHDQAAGPLNRLGDESGHSIGPLADDGFFQSPRRGLGDGFIFADVAGIAIGIWIRDMNKTIHQRAKHAMIGADASRAHRRHRNAVIGKQT